MGKMKRYTFRVYTRKHGRYISTLTVDAENLKAAWKAAREYVCGSKGRQSAQYPQYAHEYKTIGEGAGDAPEIPGPLPRSGQLGLSRHAARMVMHGACLQQAARALPRGPAGGKQTGSHRA